MRRFLASLLEVLEVAVVALGAVFLIRTFLVQPFLVSGASMAPTFENGDYLLVDEVSYNVRNPQRGEVIVFRYPLDESTYFIKRVIGVQGDTVEFTNGKVKIINSEHPDGMVLNESYLPQDIVTNPRPEKPSTFTLSAGQYLVLGDNRSYSFDSRDWGIIKSSEIIGMVRLRLWPVNDLQVFAAPPTN
ncbi:MAG: signal peptidase I [Candidatus Liptonbacteria bacterium]